MSRELILVVDDEPNIVELATLYLENEGYEVQPAYDGEEALRLFRERHPALIILDIMLPVLDGWEVCRRVRAESDVPIIILTAREAEVDKVVGLELGADDYLTKPFSPRELTARVRAVLRRYVRPVAEQPAETLRFGELVLDLARRRVTLAGSEVQLTAKEFDLLAVLASNPGIVLSREKLMEKVWGYDYYGDTRTVDVHVRHIREKLSDSTDSPRFIETVRGVGYRFSGGG